MSAPDSTAPRPVANLADLVRSAAERAPDKPALVTRDRSVSWRELDGDVEAMAAALLRLGLRRGDRVALVLGNTPEFAVAYFAALRAGGVVVPVNTAYTAGEMEFLLADSGARVVVGAPERAGALTDLAGRLDGLEHVVLAGEPVKSGVAAGPAAPPGAHALADLLVGAAAERQAPAAPSVGSEDLAVLLYTSGTSGRPKGAMLSHRALLANLDQLGRIEPPPVGPDDVLLLVLPLFHVYGLGPGLGGIARHAATGVLVERFDPVDTLAEVRRARVSVVIGAPPMYVAWSMLPDAGVALSGVRLMLSGSAPLPPEVLASMREATGRPVYEGYGLTETAPVLTTSLCSDEVKAGAVGRPLPGVELRLVTETGPVEDGDVGEVTVRGANLFSGYWPDGAGGPDADGWFATGDLGFLDPDGDLHLVDRRRELILVSGFNVYPREVEDVLLGHPDVAEAAVIGVPHPYTGESVKAFVVRRPGGAPSVEELIEHAAASLARFKCPTAVEFVDALPHSSAGKIAKGRLRAEEG